MSCLASLSKGKAERLVEEVRPREEVSLPRQCRRHVGKRTCTESVPLSVVKRRALERQPQFAASAAPDDGCNAVCRLDLDHEGVKVLFRQTRLAHVRFR